MCFRKSSLAPLSPPALIGISVMCSFLTINEDTRSPEQKRGLEVHFGVCSLQEERHRKIKPQASISLCPHQTSPTTLPTTSHCPASSQKSPVPSLPGAVLSTQRLCPWPPSNRKTLFFLKEVSSPLLHVGGTIPSPQPLALDWTRDPGPANVTPPPPTSD